MFVHMVSSSSDVDVQATFNNAKGHEVGLPNYQWWPYAHRTGLDYDSNSNEGQMDHPTISRMAWNPNRSQ